jgi:PAS domain-containing protein
MNTLQSSRIRRWTLEIDAIRRRVTRSAAGSDTAIGTMLASCLTTCENLLQELVRGEDERERLRRQAAAERDNWQRLFDIIPPPCLLTDRDGVILGANRAAALLLNVACTRLRGQLLPHFVIDRDRLHDSLQDQARLGSPVRVPVRLRPREKALVDVDVVIASNAGIAEGERLWFLLPSSEARQIREMTTVPATPDIATAGAR